MTKKIYLNKSQKTKLHKLVRELVILRDRCCLKCGKVNNLHASHIYPRGKYRKMQFDPDNVKALCLGCHLYWWHKAPLEAGKWLETVLDRQRLNRLKKRANTIDKRPLIYEEIKEDLKKQLEFYYNEHELENG